VHVGAVDGGSGTVPRSTGGETRSWVVTLHSPEEQDFSGEALEEALAWCLVWLMAPEIGVGPFW
jgi:hypothetical protein